ncbi:hypothetical protein PsAD2_03973 [Pseudovibrio axinellae]|uniref:DUF6916 domain-containing protein n=1 Tax=Pseudovibrio axinellae TaxID=989403 RepID=A0A165UPM3_9HYPH|nr:hypothetical protein [Pseudovibrio axinellae]KZL12666.1 hypothetical protein PsAD2_03973 [Pseudovibrio axinellae]SEP62324.1 hypothetical protein SAMN05421798_1017 [Pseudovibrio axinellae]
MIDLKDITAKSFENLESEEFQLKLEDQNVILKLVEVVPLRSGERKGGAFSMVWQGPLQPSLEQGSYQLTQETLGSMELFIVPIAHNTDGFKYEAVFT